MPELDQLTVQLDRLAAFEPGPYPVVSLYLDMRPDQHGRDNFEPFLRKELSERLATYPAGPERESVEKDMERIREYVGHVDPAANGLAIFASSGADLFEAMQLAAPIPEHRLFISDEPHLYPLARALDEYPRYVALVADTSSARIFVFAMNRLVDERTLEGTKTRRHKMGGWSQARYQRHVDNYHVRHAKEVADALARIVRDEQPTAIVVAGDEVILPLLREQFPKEVSDRVTDVLKLDIRASEREVLDATLAAMREHDRDTDRERVEALLGAYRGNGLAVIGADAVARALELGQVDELIIAAAPDRIAVPAAANGGNESASAADRSPQERTADELVTKARQTAARIRFIEDPALTESFGGIGAFLRFKV